MREHGGAADYERGRVLESLRRDILAERGAETGAGGESRLLFFFLNFVLSISEFFF